MTATIMICTALIVFSPFFPPRAVWARARAFALSCFGGKKMTRGRCVPEFSLSFVRAAISKTMNLVLQSCWVLCVCVRVFDSNSFYTISWSTSTFATPRHNLWLFKCLLFYHYCWSSSNATKPLIFWSHASNPAKGGYTSIYVYVYIYVCMCACVCVCVCVHINWFIDSPLPIVKKYKEIESSYLYFRTMPVPTWSQKLIIKSWKVTWELWIESIARDFSVTNALSPSNAPPKSF